MNLFNQPCSEVGALDAQWELELSTGRDVLLLRDFNISLAELIHRHQAFVRGELEARILADEPVWAIARAMELPGAAIQHYERLFFQHIRSRRTDRLWISDYVPDCQFCTDIEYHRPDQLWRRAGCTFGSELLPQLLVPSERTFVQKHGIRWYLRRNTFLGTIDQVRIIGLCWPRLTSPDGISRLLDALEVATEQWDTDFFDPQFHPTLLLLHAHARRERSLSAFLAAASDCLEDVSQRIML